MAPTGYVFHELYMCVMDAKVFISGRVMINESLRMQVARSGRHVQCQGLPATDPSLVGAGIDAIA